MKHKLKALSILLAGMLLCIGTVGTTYALLIDSTGPVKNTFTVGNVQIELYEHKYIAESNTLDSAETCLGNQYSIIPGLELPKDPVVTVKAGSEDCWVFVKVETGPTDATNYLTYAVDPAWTALDGVTGVYYKSCKDIKNDIVLNVLGYNTEGTSSNFTEKKILVKDSITEDIMENLKIIVTAYAIQKNGLDTAANAWAALFPTP